MYVVEVSDELRKIGGFMAILVAIFNVKVARIMA